MERLHGPRVHGVAGREGVGLGGGDRDGGADEGAGETVFPSHAFVTMLELDADRCAAHWQPE